MKMKSLLTALLLTMAWVGARAEVDSNFHIYLCFGQSNMEGNAQWESVDNQYVDARFQMLATTNFDSPKRTLGNWYKALCPIVSPAGKLGPTDYFGRTMVAAMPADVRIGVVAVAMGGSPIEMFDKDKYQQKLKDNPNEWWATLAKNYYGGNPYGRLIDMAKKAQESGVIKGILLHQGCSNCGDTNWPNMVKKIYNDILTDLNLQASDVPLFVGETERKEMGGGCSSHNVVVAKVPQVIPTAHVVSSENIPGNGTDAWHFSAAGYRIFGKRYAAEALKVMGRDVRMDASYSLPDNLTRFFTPKSFDNYISAKANSNVTLKLWCTFTDGHREDLTADATFSSTDFTIANGKVTTGDEGTKGIVTATVTDFTGKVHNVGITIEASGSNGLGHRFKSVAEAVGKQFAIVNEEEEKALYGSTDQNLGYDVLDKAFSDTNTGYIWRMESLVNESDASIRNCYRFRLVTPSGTDYSIWNSPGYLNSQEATGWCSFILGINNNNGEYINGQDIKNGAVWEVKYVDGEGFSLKNVGTGLYLKDATPAKYDTPTYFSFCLLGGTTSASALLPNGNYEMRFQNDNYYDLQGRRVSNGSSANHILRKGIYIVNGKKVVIR